MKKEWGWIIVLSLIIAVLLPWSLLRWINPQEEAEDFHIRVLLPDGKVEEMGLEAYLVGVVAGEMPAQFEVEALKAQAIAARTYAAKRLVQAGSDQNQKYDVDTTVQTQVWLSEAQMKKKWGWNGYFKYEKRIREAVQATKGMVLVANGEYIDAYYHSSSGRKKTEKSEDVWSSARTYLKNVESGETNPQRFVKEYNFTPQELYQKLGITGTAQNFTNNDFQILNLTAAGRAKTVSLLGKTYQATKLRTLLGLASTDIECSISPEKITFTTYGNGHGVGMSQYGANDLAAQGSDYAKILNHFYPGTEILTLTKA